MEKAACQRAPDLLSARGRLLHSNAEDGALRSNQHGPAPGLGQRAGGVSALDILIALFVLSLLLAAAVREFGSYERRSAPGAPAIESHPGEQTAPPAR